MYVVKAAKTKFVQKIHTFIVDEIDYRGSDRIEGRQISKKGRQSLKSSAYLIKEAKKTNPQI
jgi:hypothetical protein